ncbi:hypothetical protein [Mucilaginibacter kameinonensis]|uniref:hypothetical protein n=1 Tax=Mucilaginibacter kameinonensis TaxID=452286 RepID=UPI0013CE7266|nr:hypothetical protein [Mucilaginibacter kameinonensis]
MSKSATQKLHIRIYMQLLSCANLFTIIFLRVGYKGALMVLENERNLRNWPIRKKEAVGLWEDEESKYWRYFVCNTG